VQPTAPSKQQTMVCCLLGAVGWVCKNHLPYNLYCVGGDVKHCSLTHSLGAFMVLS